MSKQEILNYDTHPNWDEDFKDPVYYNFEAELLVFKLLYSINEEK